MRKIATYFLIISFVALPAITHAGFFDFLKFGNQTAQVSNSLTSASAVSAQAVYSKGDRADVVLQVQQVLNSQGLYSGNLSGLIGPKTEASIMAWQKAHSLPVTGTLDATTISSILNRGSSDGARGGGPTSGGTTSVAPTLSYLQGRCNTNDGLTSGRWVRVVSPWEGDHIQNGNDFDMKVVVCDIVGLGANRYYDLMLSNNGNNPTSIYNTTNGGVFPNDLTIDTSSYAPLRIYDLQMNTSQLPFPVGTHTLTADLYVDNDIAPAATWTSGDFYIDAGGNQQSCGPGTSPWIDLQLPADGSGYSAGNMPIIWSSCNVQDVYLESGVGGNSNGLITLNPISASQGVYQWTFTPAPGIQNDYWVSVTDANDATVFDKNYFNLVGIAQQTACMQVSYIDNYPRVIDAGVGDQVVAYYKIKNTCLDEMSVDKLTFVLASSHGYGLINQVDLWMDDQGTLTPISAGAGDFMYTVTPAGAENTKTFLIVNNGVNQLPIQPGDAIYVEMRAKTQVAPQAFYYSEPSTFVVGLSDVDYSDMVTNTSQNWTQESPVWGERTVINPL